MSDISQVLHITSAGDKVCQNRLIQPGMPVIHQSLERPCRFYKFVGHYQVSQPETCADGFRKSAYVNNTAMPVLTGNGRQGRTMVAEITVIIIFHDISADLPGPVQQAHSPFQR